MEWMLAVSGRESAALSIAMSIFGVLGAIVVALQQKYSSQTKENNQGELVVGMGPLGKVIGIGLLAMGCAFPIIQQFSLTPERWVSGLILSGLFILFGCYFWLNAIKCRVELNDLQIVKYGLFSTTEILWEDVQEVRYRKLNEDFLFDGLQGKKLNVALQQVGMEAFAKKIVSILPQSKLVNARDGLSKLGVSI